MEDEIVEPYYAGWLSLLPPVIAITLALLTKEVISSLLIGILTGTFIYSVGMNSDVLFMGTIESAFDTMANKVDFNILVFCTLLGALVYTISMAGGTRAYGKWATRRIKSRKAALLSTGGLGAFIFIDDYFNCLTVGTVMKPVTDSYKISRAKLAYIIDATAAPICIIAPISSWAAAVGSNLRTTGAFSSDFAAFVSTIPYNFYALLTIVMMISMVVMKVEFGPMLKYERNAVQTGDLFSGSNPYAGLIEEDSEDGRGKVIDLVLPILVLVSACVIGMLYSGSFFDPTNANHLNIASAFSSSDASVGLMLGSSFGLLFTLVFYGLRRAMSFKQMMECIPEGFKAMVPAIMILTFAWSLKAMTDSLGSTEFVETFVKTYAENFAFFLPAIVFLIGCFLAFATGTSWGTFGILIPITMAIFPLEDPLGIICISACMAGAVCGDHCSPISDTTIMASAGAQCDHVNHVSTQLPYAISCAVISFLSYVVAGLLVHFGAPGILALPIGIVMMLVFLAFLKTKGDKVS